MNESIYRINKVINYIQENISEDLSLSSLSNVASFSPFHFHRLFKKIVGENINQYIKRERVERAAKMLVINDEESITEIALNVGFSSASVFERAFKEHFGMSATEYREGYQQSKICKLDRNVVKASHPFFYYDRSNQSAADLKSRKGSNDLRVQVKSFEPMRVAYVRLQGYEAGQLSYKIKSAFDKAQNWVEAHDLVHAETKRIGMFYDHKAITPNESRRYDAAFTTPKQVQVGSDGVDVQDIPAGKYATCRVEASGCDEAAWNQALGELDRAFQFIMEDWIHDNGYKLEDKPGLEIYSSLTPNIVLEACVPVVAK